MRTVGYNTITNKVDISPYLPDFVADGILKVDYELLKSIGIKHLLIDLDQTLRQAYSRKLDAEVVDFFATLMQKHTFESINIVSNNNRNLTRYSTPLAARVFQPFWERGLMIRKPSAKFYNRVIAELGIQPTEAVMIGDKVRLDVAGANRVGLRTVLVHRRGRDYWFDYLLLARWREYRTLAEALKTKSRDLRSTPDYIRSALEHIQISTSAISGPSRLQNALMYTAMHKKRSISIKVLTRWQSTANWLNRLWRYLRPSWNGEEVPYFGSKHILEHEAYMTQLAQEAGVHTPTIVGILDLGDYRFGLATYTCNGTAADLLPARKLTNKLLESIWQQAHKLHTKQIAHGQLRMSNFIIDAKNQPELRNFDFATSNAPEQKIIRDRVELFVSMSLYAGATNTAEAALKTIGPKALLSIQTDLRLSNLSYRTRTDIHHQHLDLADLSKTITTVATIA